MAGTKGGIKRQYFINVGRKPYWFGVSRHLSASYPTNLLQFQHCDIRNARRLFHLPHHPKNRPTETSPLYRQFKRNKRRRNNKSIQGDEN